MFQDYRKVIIVMVVIMDVKVIRNITKLSKDGLALRANNIIVTSNESIALNG